MPLLFLIIMLAAALPAFGKLSPEQITALPPPAAHPVDFEKHVKPIFEASCIKCHGKGKDKGGFVMDTRETLMKGGDSGPAVIEGKSAESYLIELVAAVDEDNVMPAKGTKLTADQVGILRAWIDQGAKWPDTINFAKAPALNLLPRKPPVPRNGKTNPIDAFLAEAQRATETPRLVDDRTFARRVYLDVLGVLPTPEEANDFLADRRPDKRARLVGVLLSDNRRYAEHWLSYWNDLLRNDYRGAGYIDGGRKQITQWLYSALATNMPFNRFVGQLVNPVPESQGFTKGIVWRGVVNASQTPEMQAAQNISQVFMGVNLKCASCHDSFIDDWRLSDAYGFASIYADAPLEMVECDRPTGKEATMRFLYEELGTIDAKAPKPERLRQLETVMTSDKNARLTRTIVNRLWARFLGRGLVEPVDEMERPAWNQDLLDWLAADLADNGYNIKHTIERILTSHAYQRPSVGESETPSKEFTFEGPLVRRMSAEQYIDALASVTGIGQAWPNAQIDLRQGEQSPNITMEQGITPKWIWSTADAHQKAAPGTNYVRKAFTLTEIPDEAHVLITCDNSYKLFVNEKEVGSGNDFSTLKFTDIREHLKIGNNVIAIRAINAPPPEEDDDDEKAGKVEKEKAKKDPSSPAGLFAYVRLRAEHQENGIPVEDVWDFATDNSWLVSSENVDGWQAPGFDTSSWKHAAELGDPDLAPWKLAEKFATTLSNASLYGQIRSSLVNNDPLMTALGRPNREQVVSVRPSIATTLQALELTNGETLAQHFERAAEELMEELPSRPESVVHELYARAIQRPPTARELALSTKLLGSPVQKAGIEDLLWAISMLPEFQLIY